MKMRLPFSALAVFAITIACSRPAPAPAPEPIAATPIQTQTPPPVVIDTAAASRERAVAELERVARALGNVAAIGGNAIDITYSTGGPTGWQQSRVWSDTTSRNTGVQHFVADFAQQRGHIETVSNSPGPIRFIFRSAFDSTGGGRVDMMRWRNGDWTIPIAPAQARNALSTIERVAPHLAIRQAMRQATLRDGGERQRFGRSVRVVQWRDPANNQPIEMEIDPASGLPSGISGDNQGTWAELSDYRAVSGVLVPHTRRMYQGERLFSEHRIAQVDLQPNLDDSLFRVPPGYIPAPTTSAARATRIANNVYRLDDMPGGYHSAFVVRDTDVVVFEGPHSPVFTDTALRLIAGVAPGKPVTHVFVSHHHSDHVGGLGPYVARGAKVVTSAFIEEGVRRQLPDSLRARAQFITLNGSQTFGTGASRIVTYLVDNGHAAGNTAYYMPAHRVLFQGDLFFLPEVGPVTSAFSVTEELARVVEGAKLRVDQVVGVHGRTGTWADVRTSLELRKKDPNALR